MGRDYTKYNLEGLGENLNKRQLVFTIVKDWATKNKPSLEEIQTAFPDEVQGGKGFIAKESEVKDAKRFNMKEPLSIKNGLHVVVSNQWGSKNIDGLLSLANGLGYTILKVNKKENTEKPTGSSASASFDITQLSMRDFKKLITTTEDKAALEASLLKQAEFNIDFWSYLLMYDYIVNEGAMELSGKLMDDAADAFLIEWYEIHEEQEPLAQFVLDKLELDFEEVQTDNEKRILFNASFGSYLYFSLKEFATVEDIEESDLAGYLASHDHTLLRDGEDVFDSHGVGDDWLVTLGDEWLMYCGFDSSDYEGECGVHLVNTEWQEFSIDYNRMAEDIIAQFA